MLELLMSVACRKAPCMLPTVKRPPKQILVVVRHAAKESLYR